MLLETPLSNLFQFRRYSSIFLYTQCMFAFAEEKELLQSFKRNFERILEFFWSCLWQTNSLWMKKRKSNFPCCYLIIFMNFLMGFLKMIFWRQAFLSFSLFSSEENVHQCLNLNKKFKGLQTLTVIELAVVYYGIKMS